MRIVLKPLGVIVIVGAIIILALLAFRTSALRKTVTDRSSPNLSAAPFTPELKASSGGKSRVYTDGLENGWMERGWAKLVDYAATSPVRGGGGTAIRVEAAPYEAAKIYNPVADLSAYNYLVFFAHGGNEGGQTLAVATVAAGKTQKRVTLSPLPANKWVRVVLPLSELGIAGRKDVHAFWVQSDSSEPAVFHIDDIAFRDSPPDNVAEETLAFSDPKSATNTP